jgi:hypothetical protein
MLLMTHAARVGFIVIALALLFVARPPASAATVQLKPDTTSVAPADFDVAAYRDLLARVVRGDRVDYRAIVADRAALDRIVAAFAEVPATIEKGWAARERMAFWINAYNVFTLRAIVDHYPIRGSRFSLSPRNSIRQIDGVWTTLEWRAAGRTVTLDDIEHRILRPEFGDARVHMAVNCASKSCPPLRAEPYAGADLDRQLDEAAQRYLASPAGTRVAGGRLLVSRIFEWYGDDFIKRYAAMHPGSGRAADRAIRGFVERYGPPEAAAASRSDLPIRFLDYDWSLNDVASVVATDPP